MLAVNACKMIKICLYFQMWLNTYPVFFIIAIVQVWSQNFSSPKCTLCILSSLPYPNTIRQNNPQYTDGPDIVPSEYLAVEMINNRSDILKEYYLELLEGHDGCGSTKNTPVQNMLVQNIFYSGKNVVGIAGPRCFASAEIAGLITAKDGIALVNIHASSSMNLGERSLYPNSFGATPSIERFVDAYVALIVLNKWRHVGILFQDDAGSYSTFHSLNSKLDYMSDYDMSFSSVITENYIPFDALQASSARAIFVIINSKLARMLLCIAYTKGAVFPQYQWTFAYRVPAEFVDINFVYKKTSYNCSKSNLLLALENSIIINLSYEPHPDDWNKTGISGLTYPQYKQEYARAIQRYNTGFYGAPVRNADTTLWGNPFHDAVWILALALNATDTRLKQYNKSLCEFGYGQPNIAHMIQEEISRLDFLGVGGRISYSNQSNFAPGMVKMWHVTSKSSQNFGYYTENRTLHITQENVSFLHPILERYKINVMPSAIFLIGSVVALILTAITNVLSVIFRHHESVKASSHRLNNMAYVGSYLLSLCIIMLTLTEGFFLPLAVKTVLCNGIIWMASVGFTAIYATVVVKIFRIYRLLIIAVKKLQKPSNSKILRDSVLLAVIVILIALDIAICTVWQSANPIHINAYTSIQKDSTEPVYVTYDSCVAQFNQGLLPWLLPLFIYNSILCGVTTFIAFLTRSISVKNFQTGNILLLSTLQFICFGIGVPTLIILNLYHNGYADFIISVYTTACLLLSCLVYLCLFLLFLPPLYPTLKELFLHKKMCAISFCHKEGIQEH